MTIINMLKFIRYLLGWQDLINVPKENSVVVYCHTSYWEAFIVQLYAKECNVVSVMKPDYFNDFTRPILNWLGFIEGPRLEDRGSGGVKAIAKTLALMASERPTLFLISPKGTIHNMPWRTGYEFIAKELGWPVSAMLVDYSRRTIEFKRPLNTMASLKSELGTACPRVPERAEMPITCTYDPFELVCVVDSLIVSNVFMLWPIAKALYFGHGFVALLATASTIMSVAYHASRETQWHEIDSCLAKLLIVYGLISYGVPSTSAAFWLVAALWLYSAGTPRHCKDLRGPYVVYHSLFHACISFAAWASIH